MKGVKIQFFCQALALCVLLQLGYHHCDAQTEADDGNLFYYHQSEYPKDCQEIKNQCSSSDETKNGVYVIKPEGLPEPIEVYCDQTTDDGGWTVIQRRIDGSIDFERTYDHYKDGFGFLNQEFWLGNNYTAHLTNQKRYVLRIDMMTQADRPINVTYNYFRLSDNDGQYKLKLGDFAAVSGTTDSFATNEMDGQNAQTFKIDACSGKGGWWYNTGSCGDVKLNDKYFVGSTTDLNLRWKSGTKLKYVEIKVRPHEQ